MPHLEFECTKETYRPGRHDIVRWLDPYFDLGLVRESWESWLQPPTQETWDALHQQGYRYCAIIYQGLIVAVAAVWTYSEEAWELAAVHTHPDFRRLGCAKATCAFVTDYIIRNHRRATCHTTDTNEGMIAVLKGLGYRLVPEEP